MKKSFKYFAIVSLTLATQFASAQEAGATAGNSNTTLMAAVVCVFAVIALLLLRVATQLLTAVNTLSKAKGQAKDKVDTRSAWEKALALNDMQDEKDLALGHSYDGIDELNNPIPAWFNYLFYVTIVFAVVYLLNYHVFQVSPLPKGEYENELAAAQVAKDAYLQSDAGKIDETNVQQTTDATALNSGKGIFKQNCVPCHGEAAQGIVGPNLTDKYWLGGGKIGDIFKTIKYGRTEKGMVSWEKTLNPQQISDVANYILSLQGSNPPNPKAPQGEEMK